MNANRLIAALAGGLFSVVIATAPVLAAAATASAPLAPQSAASIRCIDEWLAARQNPSVQTVKVVGDCEVDRRLDTIGNLRTILGDARNLTADHRTTLTAILDHSQSGLTALRAEIDGDTTLASLREDVHRIFTDYRIYALVARQVRLVIGDDIVAAAGARLNDAADRIAAAIDTVKGNGKDVTEAQKHLDAMRAATADALAQVSGDAATVLAQTPAAWNAGTAEPILQAARASITAARSDIRTAASEARAAIKALK